MARKKKQSSTKGVFCDVCKRWFPGKKGTTHKCLAKLRIRDKMTEGIVPAKARNQSALDAKPWDAC
jgi:hypothetical protein